MEIGGKRLGICFSGGAAYGFAHLGVIRALEELNIEPEVVSGASMGAIIGALYSNGYSYKEMMDIIEKQEIYKVFNLVSPLKRFNLGLSSKEKIEEILKEVIPHNSFEGLEREFHLSVTDIYRPDWEVVSSGKLVEYVLASMSIPLLFEPSQIDGKCLVDGGVMNNLPVEPLTLNNCYIIGCDVQSTFHKEEISSAKTMAKRYYQAMMKEMQKPRVAECDTYITFEELSRFDIYDFSDYLEIVNIGYDSAKPKLEELMLRS